MIWNACLVKKQGGITQGKHVPSMHQQGVLSCHNLLTHCQITARGHTPATRTKSLVENASVLDLGQVDDAVGLDLNVVKGNCLHEHSGDFWTKGYRRQAVEGRGPIDAIVAGAIASKGSIDGRLGKRACAWWWLVGRRGDGVDLVLGVGGGCWLGSGRRGWRGSRSCS